LQQAQPFAPTRRRASAGDSTRGYKFRDYFQVGARMTMLVFVVVLALLPRFWPLS